MIQEASKLNCAGNSERIKSYKKKKHKKKKKNKKKKGKGKREKGKKGKREKGKRKRKILHVQLRRWPVACIKHIIRI